MKTHYDPFSWDDEGLPESTMCGTRLGDGSEVTFHWKEVTCIRCLKSRESIEKAVEQDCAAIAEQLGDMAEFMKQQEPSHDN